MIESWENGTRKVTLGEGMTYISQVIPKGTNCSSGILFSSKPLLDKKFLGDEVIVEITSFKGAMSYIKPILELLKKMGN